MDVEIITTITDLDEDQKRRRSHPGSGRRLQYKTPVFISDPVTENGERRMGGSERRPALPLFTQSIVTVLAVICCYELHVTGFDLAAGIDTFLPLDCP